MTSSAHRTGVTRLLLALCALVALLAAAPPARAEGQTQAAYLADRLREDPVYVTDQLPREVPRSMAADLARLAERAGVPTYVLVLPSQAGHGDGLLGAVHDRLGRDGVYVLVDESGVADAAAFGVRAPVDAAMTVALYELPYDAGPLRGFERFVEVVAQGGEEAAARAEAAREKYGDDDPADLYIGPSDRRNQSFLTGVALAGVPLAILLLVPCVRRWRRGPPSEADGGRRPSARRRLLSPALAALVMAAAIAVTALLLFDQTRSSAAPTPTPADVSARLDRVADGLSRDPVYQDSESPRVLDAAQLSRLHDRIERFARSEGGGPVFVTVVPHMPEDETAGDEELFATAVRSELDRDAVYVVADPASGYLDVFNHGLRLDSYDLLFGLPDSITYGSDKADEADDHLLGERLDALMTYLDKMPRTAEPTTTGVPDTAPDPGSEHALPPLFATDFWPGLFVGALLALLLLMLVGGVLRAIRKLRPRPTRPAPLTAPTEPSTAYLRRTARAELRAATASLDSASRDTGPDTRAWERLDAALLLLDGEAARLRDAAPARLLGVLVLARAARAALDGDDNDRCCGVNPLHGPAVARHHVKVAPEGNRRRFLPVCEFCRNAAIATPRELYQLILTLPGPAGSRTRVPYDDASDGLLTALPDGYGRLVNSVREATHVH
ncbi:hypothetical protein ACWD00_08575 [Streptomyces viridiviolaceus]